eukprot:TRINITY_DN41_c1_g1_i16.p1 TRINITY_DN41_c1_g1~~TRINITY_DN41_c1_g1_i16.p1  ORF type:complete len:1811 (+),score=354.69 TRINITY_DN41_c1_g1_i16:827-6259(+)
MSTSEAIRFIYELLLEIIRPEPEQIRDTILFLLIEVGISLPFSRGEMNKFYEFSDIQGVFSDGIVERLIEISGVQDCIIPDTDDVIARYKVKEYVDDVLQKWDQAAAEHPPLPKDMLLLHGEPNDHVSDDEFQYVSQSESDDEYKSPSEPESDQSENFQEEPNSDESLIYFSDHCNNRFSPLVDANFLLLSDDERPIAQRKGTRTCAKNQKKNKRTKRRAKTRCPKEGQGVQQKSTPKTKKGRKKVTKKTGSKRSNKKATKKKRPTRSTLTSTGEADTDSSLGLEAETLETVKPKRRSKRIAAQNPKKKPSITTSKKNQKKLTAEQKEKKVVKQLLGSKKRGTKKGKSNIKPRANKKQKGKAKEESQLSTKSEYIETWWEYLLDHLHTVEDLKQFQSPDTIINKCSKKLKKLGESLRDELKGLEDESEDESPPEPAEPDSALSDVKHVVVSRSKGTQSKKIFNAVEASQTDDGSTSSKKATSGKKSTKSKTQAMLIDFSVYLHQWNRALSNDASEDVRFNALSTCFVFALDQMADHINKQRSNAAKLRINFYLDRGLPPGEEHFNSKSYIHISRAISSAKSCLHKRSSPINKWSLYQYTHLLFQYEFDWIKKLLSSRHGIQFESVEVKLPGSKVFDADGQIRADARRLSRQSGMEVTILTKDSDMMLCADGSETINVSYSHTPSDSFTLTPTLQVVYRALKLCFGWSDYPSLIPSIPPQLKTDALDHMVDVLFAAMGKGPLTASLVMSKFLKFQMSKNRKTGYNESHWMDYISQQCIAFELPDDFRVKFCQDSKGNCPKRTLGELTPVVQPILARQQLALLELRTVQEVLIGNLPDELLKYVPLLPRALDIAIELSIGVEHLSILYLCNLMKSWTITHDDNVKRAKHSPIRQGQINNPQQRKEVAVGKEPLRLNVLQGNFVRIEGADLQQQPFRKLIDKDNTTFADFQTLLSESNLDEKEQERILGRLLIGKESVDEHRKTQEQAVQERFATLQSKFDELSADEIKRMFEPESPVSLAKAKASGFKGKGMTATHFIGTIEESINPKLPVKVRTTIAKDLYDWICRTHSLQAMTLKMIKDTLVSGGEHDWETNLKAKSDFQKSIATRFKTEMAYHEANIDVVATVLDLVGRSLFVHLPLLLSQLPDTHLTPGRIKESIVRTTGKTLSETLTSSDDENDEDALALAEPKLNTKSIVNDEKRQAVDEEVATLLTTHLGIVEGHTSAQTICNIKNAQKHRLFTLFQSLPTCDSYSDEFKTRLSAIPMFDKFQLGDVIIEFSSMERLLCKWAKSVSEELKTTNRSLGTLNENVCAWANTKEGAKFFDKETLAALLQYAQYTPYKTAWDVNLHSKMVPWAIALFFNVFRPREFDSNATKRVLNVLGKHKAPQLGHSVHLSGKLFGVTIRKPVSPNRANAFYNKPGAFNDTQHWLFSPDRTKGDLHSMICGIDMDKELSVFSIHRVAYTMKQMFHDPIGMLDTLTTDGSQLRERLGTLIRSAPEPPKRRFVNGPTIIRPIGILPTDKQITPLSSEALKLFSLAGLDPGAKSHKVTVINFDPDQLRQNCDSACVPWFVFVTLTLSGKPKNKMHVHEIPPLPSAPDTLDAWDKKLHDLYNTQVTLGQNYYLEEKSGRHALRKLDDRNAGIIHKLAYDLPELRSSDEDGDEEHEPSNAGISGKRLPILCFGAAQFSGAGRKRLAEVCAQSMPVIMVDEHLTSQVCAQCCTIAEKVDRADVVGTRLFACPHCNADGGMYHKDRSASILIAQKVFFALNGINFNSCSRMFNRLHRDTTTKIWNQQTDRSVTKSSSPSDEQQC